MNNKIRKEVNEISGIDELRKLLDDQNINTNDLCLTGSACLAIRDIRQNGDLDFVVSTDLRSRVDSSEYDIISARRPNKYLRIYITDDELIYNSKYHDVIGGFKIIRPELYYSMKKIRINSKSKKRDKDFEDISLIQEYKKNSDDWNSELVIEHPRSFLISSILWGIDTLRTKGIKHVVMQGFPDYLRNFTKLWNETDYYGEPTNLIGKARRSYRVDGPKKTFARGINLIKIYEPTGLLDRYSNLNHKAKVGTLVDRKLDLTFPTGEFLTEQYSDGQFTRMDLIVRLLAIDSLAEKDNIPDLVEKFESISGEEVVEPIKKVGEYDRKLASKKAPNFQPVLINEKYTLLTPNRLAESLWNDPISFHVEIRSDGGNENYPIDWFEGNDFSKEEVEQIQARYKKLLYDSGTLFVFVLWPPAIEYSDEIINKIDMLSNVVFHRKLSFSEDQFAEFVKDMYGMQTLKEKYKQQKIEQLKSYKKKVVVGAVELETPKIREGKSHKMNEIKEHVRKQFTLKIIPNNPSANIIMHSTDNFVHNRTTLDVVETYLQEEIY